MSTPAISEEGDTGGAHVRELRSQMREWRRGRADTTLMEALSDAYIAVFAAAMLTASAANAILHTRAAIARGCTTTACVDARGALPWLCAGTLVTLTLVLARIVGPLMVTPAVGAWLLAAPVDRAALLRPRLWILGAMSFLTGGVVSSVIAALVGFGPSEIAGFGVGVAAACTAAVMGAAVAQSRSPVLLRVITWVLGGAVWLGLVAVTVHVVPDSLADAPAAGLLAGAAAVLVLAAVVLTVGAARRLRQVHRDRLTPGGALLSSLSGALASLDLALMYDILVARRWLARSTVRSVRGGPGGAWALVWRDVVRLRRSPVSLVLLAAALVVPYVVVALDLGPVVALVTGLTGFLTGLWLCSALRTTSRTPGLVRCFPLSSAVVRAACLAVPAVVLFLWALAATPAIHRGLPDVGWDDALAIAVAVGAAAVSAIARWLLAQPPDYSKPLVSSPMGAIPTGLIGSALRGFDVLLLVTAPVLFAPTVVGAEISVALAGIVLAVLLGRK
jgi:hypothetical protein